MTGSLIKVCGLTDPANIREVVSLRPDWIGMIFHPSSPRYVGRPESLSFLNDLEPPTKKMGVFVNSSLEEIREITGVIRFDGIQLHGHESPGLCQQLRDDGYLVFKAFGISPGIGFDATLPYLNAVDFFLFDTWSPGHGGTGKQFDWGRLDEYHGDIPFLLSGGLTPETRSFPVHPRFAGVDLNSRFETSPGIKDVGLLKTFINHYRNE